MLGLYDYIISNSMYVSIVIISSLTSLLICKNSSSAKFKYSILKLTLLFCVVPFNILLGEVISYTNILDFNYIKTHESNYKLQRINFDNDNYIQSYTRINNTNSINNDLVNITSLTENISDRGSIIEAKLIESGLYILWVFGVVINILWFGYCYICYKKHLKRSKSVDNKGLLELLEVSKKSLNINKRIDLYYNKDFTTPILCGIFKPIIVIPQAFTEYKKLDSDKLKSIITHELVHYRRKDLRVKALLLVVQILNWFNPFVYLLSKYVNKYLEFSCDEEVVMKLDKEQRKVYGVCIIEHATLSNNKNSYIVASLSSKAKKEAVKERVNNMMNFKNKKVSKAVVGLMCVSMCGAITIPAIAYSNNANSSEDSSDSSDSSVESIKFESDITPIEERIVDIAVLDYISYKDDVIFDKSDYISNKEGEEYSKYLIESLYGVNFDSVQPIFSIQASRDFYMRSEVLTAIFDDTQENDVLIICDIDAETFKVYRIDSLVKGNQMPVDINLITQETKEYLTSEAINILNKIGLSVSDKEIDYYLTGNNNESISVGFKDGLGNYEFVEFSSPEYKFVSYSYYENNSVALESVLNVLNFNTNSIVISEGTAEFSANSGGRGAINYEHNKDDDDNYEAKVYFKNLGTSEVNIKTYTASNQEVHSVILEVGQFVNCVFNEENLVDGMGSFHVESKDGADAKVYYKYSALDK